MEKKGSHHHWYVGSVRLCDDRIRKDWHVTWG